MKYAAAAIALNLLFAGPAVSQQYPTIVGEWYAEDYGPQACGTPAAIHIGPKSWTEDEYVCRFQDVSRDGWQVTWNGSCSDGATEDKMRLVVVERNGRLHTAWNGNAGSGTLRRCTR